jgi:hypothetical protein
MKTEIKIFGMQQTYEAPSAEIVIVAIEKGFADSEDNEVVFKGSAYDAMVSDFANCEVVNFRPMNYTIIVQLLT